jgi:hypothetical protein
MNKLNIEPLEVEKTKLVLQDIKDDKGEASILLMMSGEIDMRDPSQAILPHLLKIHEALIAQEIKIISVDFSNLLYVNSSGIKTMISWLMKSKDVESGKGYQVKIIQNSDLAWQESTFPVIQKLFPDVVTFAGE